MDKVENLSNSKCCTPSSQPFRNISVRVDAAAGVSGMDQLTVTLRYVKACREIIERFFF
jgi:hypothetical protein